MPKLKTVKTPLSKKLWVAIRQAVADLNAVEKADGYFINMSTWHEPTFGGCDVCLAGCVLARRLCANPNFDVHPQNSDTDRMLLAINAVRRGEINHALSLLRLTMICPIKWFSVEAYEDNPEQFKRDMLAIADYLEDNQHLIRSIRRRQSVQ